MICLTWWQLALDIAIGEAIWRTGKKLLARRYPDGFVIWRSGRSDGSDGAQ